MASTKATATFMFMFITLATLWWFSPGASAAFVNGNYVSEDPAVAENCLYYSKNALTSECATQIYVSIGKKKVEVTDSCCQRIVRLGKVCWASIFSLEVDDPCHFFREITKYCTIVAADYVPGRKGGPKKKVPSNKVTSQEMENIPAGCNKFK